MGVQMISLNCPKCGADLEVASDREYFFCEYCGHKIYVSDSNHQKYTYRKIDDARIKEATVLETVRLKEIELELEKEKQKAKREKANNIIFLIMALLIFIPFALLILREVFWW